MTFTIFLHNMAQQNRNNMKQQTAVEFLLENIHLLHSLKWNDVIEQAKQMEKEQIVAAYQQGTLDGYELKYGDGNQYYNETYEK